VDNQSTPENGNGYTQLLNDNSEETILLSEQTKEQENSANEHPSNSMPQTFTISQLEDKPPQSHKVQHSQSTVQFTLQMMVTASLLLQGTWFIQVICR